MFIAIFGGAIWLDEVIRRPTWRDPQISVLHIIGFVLAIIVIVHLARKWMKP